MENLDKAAIKDVKMLLSYDDDEIGSCMTTNYICIPKGLSVRQAMSELVRQAGTNDNISTIYVLDESLKFAGAIDLKDLIIARKHDVLDDIIVRSYPSVTDHEKLMTAWKNHGLFGRFHSCPVAGRSYARCYYIRRYRRDG